MDPPGCFEAVLPTEISGFQLHFQASRALQSSRLRAPRHSTFRRHHSIIIIDSTMRLSLSVNKQELNILCLLNKTHETLVGQPNPLLTSQTPRESSHEAHRREEQGL